jgi:protein involved in polysaccharide export with SLBB domain
MLQWHGQPRPPSYFYDGVTYYTDGVTVAGSVTFPASYAYDPDDTLCDAFAAT